MQITLISASADGEVCIYLIYHNFRWCHQTYFTIACTTFFTVSVFINVKTFK